jgi:hypothetical protein
VEVALGVGVRERIASGDDGGGQLRLRAGGEIEKRVGRFCRKMLGENEQGVFVGYIANVRKPLGRNPASQELVFRDMGE